MEDTRSAEVLELSYNERRIIESVLLRYDFQVLNIQKVRSVYKVETKRGCICLKKMRHGRGKVGNGNILVEQLLKNDFVYIPRYYKTKDDRLYVERKKFIFYATEWINGKECSMSDLDETCQCVKLLAEFHNAARKIDKQGLKMRNNIKNWPIVFSKNLFDLERYKRIIENKRIKNQFDSEYMGCIDNFYARGMFAMELLKNSQYYSMSKQAAREKTICHDSFYYQNIIKKDNVYYIVDLDSIIFDLQINDLGKLIRRVMFKKEYSWDFGKAKALIDAYDSVLKLSKNELEVMLALIIFPHKFWKLGKKRYIKHKGWNEDKYLHKLTKLMMYDSMEEKFLKDYLDYLENY